MVQAALTGDSVAFDPRGRLLAWKGSSFRGVAVVRIGLPPASARTPYDQLGDYVPWTAMAIAALAAAVALYPDGKIGRKVRPHRPGRHTLGRQSAARPARGGAPAALSPEAIPSDGSPAAAPRAE